MNIFKKIMTALRGSTREIGEAIVDAQGTRIFEQEIYDAEEHIQNAKRELTGVMAKHKQAIRELEAIKKSITQNENYALQAIDKGEETLALEIAQKIADFEQELAIQSKAASSYETHTTRLKDKVREGERQINDFKRQVSMVKTTDSVHKATAAISDSFNTSDSQLASAKDSLKRIKQKQQEFEDRMQASDELTAEEHNIQLDDKIAAAGIDTGKADAHTVLARLKVNVDAQI